MVHIYSLANGRLAGLLHSCSDGYRMHLGKLKTELKVMPNKSYDRSVVEKLEKKIRYLLVDVKRVIFVATAKLF